jgi:hypothetical protein
LLRNSSYRREEDIAGQVKVEKQCFWMAKAEMHLSLAVPVVVIGSKTVTVVIKQYRSLNLESRSWMKMKPKNTSNESKIIMLIFHPTWQGI